MTSAAGTIAALASTAVLLAACGSSSSSSSASGAAAAASTTTSTPAASSTSASSGGGGVTVRTAKGPHGAYLVGPDGRALYLWAADTSSKSSCSGACAQAWPPLTTTGKPSAGPGVNAADLGTTARSDGSQEVTYKGHPLYYFIADKSAGETKGQGSNNFGAKWWLVAPSGTAITAVGSTGSSGGSASGGSSTSGSSSGGGGGWG